MKKIILYFYRNFHFFINVKIVLFSQRPFINSNYLMNILYIGDIDKITNSYLLSKAFKKIGNKIFLINPLGKKKTILTNIISIINYKFDTSIFNFYLFRQLNKQLKNIKFKVNLIIISQGEYYDETILYFLKKKFNCKIVSIIIDNPFSDRDYKRFSLFKKAIDCYDYFFAVRKETYRVLKKKNKKVFLFRRTYDEDEHCPYFSKNKPIDIIFVGTWMRNESRDYYLKELILSKFNVKIFGNQWHKSKYYQILEPFVFPAIYKRQYAKEVSKSKICLCFLSKGNQDQDTIRTYEIPYMGGLLVAERTKVHVNTYLEGTEALFFSNIFELKKKIKFVLNHPLEAEKIRKAGMKKVKLLKVGNMDLARFVISKTLLK